MSSSTTRQRVNEAPEPDDLRKPNGPTDVKSSSWKLILRNTVREFSSDHCIDIAASLTYYAVLSIFPALIALVSLLGVFGQGRKAISALLSVLQSVAPSSAVTVIRGPLEQFASSPAAGFALVSGVVVAIWSASGYVSAFSRGMNRIYEIDEGRPFWKLKPQQLLVTVIGIALMLIVAVILVVSGPVTTALGTALRVGESIQVVWSIAKWPVLAFVAVLLIAILYFATPNAKQPRFRWMTMGALIALIVLVIATTAFGLYVTVFGHYAKTYGPLAGVIVFLLWLWIANIALLFGAEFDAETERGRELQAGIAAEENIQLPPRDTRKSDKASRAEKKDIARARRLRESERGALEAEKEKQDRS
jgi:membrane protein